MILKINQEEDIIISQLERIYKFFLNYNELYGRKATEEYIKYGNVFTYDYFFNLMLGQGSNI